MAVTADASGGFSGMARSLLRVLASRFLYGIGPRYYSLFALRELPPSEWSRFVTDDGAFQRLQFERSPQSMRDLMRDKAAFYEHCLKHDLPTIPIIGMVGKGRHSGYSFVKQIESPAQWGQAISEQSSLFVKSVDGSFGEGAFRVTRLGDRFEYEGRTGTAAELYAYLCAGLDRYVGWIVQPRVKNHLQIAQMMSPDTLGTIRVVTWLHSGVAKAVAAVMKVPVGASVTDNFHHGKSGNLLAAFDLTTGRLSMPRGSIRQDWPVMRSFPEHPDSGAQLEGFIVPYWSDVVQLALKAQQSLPLLRSAGWDIAVTDAGVKLLEGNNVYATDILQIAHLRGMRQEFLQALGAR
jgi:hypothetical protein